MKSETESPLTVLVTGASGNLGRRVVELLLESTSGAPAKVVAGSRDPAKLGDLQAKGAETRRVDFDDAASLVEAFAGIDRLLLISTDAVMVPSQRIAQHRAAIEAAVKAGVKHIVYTSTVNAVENSPLLVAPDHLATEQALVSSGLGYTVLRNNYYADNLLPALTQGVSSGQWFSAAGEGRISYVSREDCARVAAAALASDFAGQRTLEVTGPQALNIDEMAAAFTTATGFPLQVVQVPAEGLIAGMTAHGLPQVVAELVASFDTASAAGLLAPVTGVVKELTGREPETLPDFFRRHATAFGVSKSGA